MGNYTVPGLLWIRLNGGVGGVRTNSIEYQGSFLKNLGLQLAFNPMTSSYLYL